LGGTARFLGHHALLGFHAAYTDQRDSRSGVGEANAILGAYLAHLGLSYSAIAAVTVAGPDEMNWLDVDAANNLGIKTRPLPQERNFGGIAQNTSQSPTSSANGSLESRASQFVLTYFARGSDAAERAIAFDAAIYAPTVNYYGTVSGKTDILNDKTKYVHRWPERIYIPIGTSIHVSCDDNESTCTVTGSYNFECRSYARGAYSAGAADFALTLAFSGPDIRIIGEYGRVTQRR
jgi:hypothetical protein